MGPPLQVSLCATVLAVFPGQLLVAAVCCRTETRQEAGSSSSLDPSVSAISSKAVFALLLLLVVFAVLFVCWV